MLAPILSLVLLVVRGLAQVLTVSETSTITGDVFPSATLLFPASIQTGFAGALVQATSCRSTYALQCTDESLCTLAQATVTQGAFDYIVTLYSTSADITRFISASCSLLNLYSAACTSYLSSANGSVTTTNTLSSTLSGTELRYIHVPITAGGESLTAAAACSASASISAATASATAAPATSSAAHDDSSQDNDNGVSIGVGVGVGVGVSLILGAIAGYFFFRRHARKKTKADEEDRKDAHAPPAYAATMSPITPMTTHPTFPVQLDSPSEPHNMGELPAEVRRYEMGGDSEVEKNKAGTCDERYEMPAGKS